MSFYPEFDEVLDRLIKKAKKYDSINLSVTDLNGILRTKTIPGDVFHRVVKGEGGIGMYSGTYSIAANSDAFYPEIFLKHYMADGFLIPQDAPPYENHWCAPATAANEKVLEVICDIYWKHDKSQVYNSPRHLTNKLLRQLDEQGLSIYSAMEYEFTVFESDGKTPAWRGVHAYSNIVIRKVALTVSDLKACLKKAGIPVRSVNTEYGPGQLEITIFPKYGITMADDAIMFKHAVMETFLNHNFKATFMSKSDETSSPSSGHYNFSIWNKEKTKNLFYDSEAEDNLSQLARRFISGIITHAKALTGLFDPTVNCYRRLVPHTFAPFTVSWSYEAREAFIRAKNSAENCTYLEVRAPSGSSNPYLVLSGVIAAGLDGIKRNLDIPPFEGDITDCELLPRSLDEALNYLENDEILVESLGEDFVDHYITLKRKLEIAKLEGMDDIEKERQLYMDLI